MTDERPVPQVLDRDRRAARERVVVVDYRHDVLRGEELLAQLRGQRRGLPDYSHVELAFEHRRDELIRSCFGQGD